MQETILDDYQLEMENRIRNLLWTVSGDYTLEMKPNVETFCARSLLPFMTELSRELLPNITTKICWECIWSRNFLQGLEIPLTAIAQLCVEEAIGEKNCQGEAWNCANPSTGISGYD